jgi:hypothetical protein
MLQPTVSTVDLGRIVDDDNLFFQIRTGQHQASKLQPTSERSPFFHGEELIRKAGRVARLFG